MRTFKCKWCRKKTPVDTELINVWIYRFDSKKCRLDFNRAKARKEKEKIVTRKIKAKAKKANSVSSLTKKADKLYSEYIRKRDAIWTTWTLDRIICITCWETKDYIQFDCGHFVTRANKSTRWDYLNSNAQCKVCNNWGSWRQYEHWKAIDKKYWEWTADKIMQKWRTIFKLNSIYLQEKIEDLINKLKEYE